MEYYSLPFEEVINTFNSNKDRGLSHKKVLENRKKYGENIINKTKKKSLFKKIFDVLSEPMIVILIFSFVIAFGVALGKYIKTGESDFAESFGILSAILLSVLITLIMEGSSEKAFNVLSKVYENVVVRVLRDSEVILIPQNELVAGDIVLLESGDKILADGRLIEDNSLSVNESALTGESNAVFKNSSEQLKINTPLADRKNSVFSGTFVASGNGKMIVTKIGNDTEIGKIASQLSKSKNQDSPLSQKLSKLSKIITIIGSICAILVFLSNLFKLILTGNVNFSNIQNLFVSCIVLIVAAVPEGLPTIVAVSLALNMIKLAKGNALIKKLTATETAGAISVICTDKTGTLTTNKMSLSCFCKNDYCLPSDKIKDKVLLQNFICNTTADIVKKNKEEIYFGNGTECALISCAIKSNKDLDYRKYRHSYKIIKREPFSNDKKYMMTEISDGDKTVKLIKGAAEKILFLCDLTKEQIYKIQNEMSSYQKQAKRVLCFAHKDSDKEKYTYDGFAVISDKIRPEVFSAVSDCMNAGIKIKVLTGDNFLTAYSVAKELKIVDSLSEVINAKDLENMSDSDLKKLLPKIKVISRSTPTAKLRVVEILKEMGEVVAVTGDGINDAPAIKHADIGFSMGNVGSEITKEAADIVLLDDSFSTIVKSISFGRNVYRNIQRFIMFQLSVNLSALLFITISSVLGLETPFNTFQLLWINVIMDGPPAITLGLENAELNLMNLDPVKRDKSIVSVKMLLKIAFNGIFIAGALFLQYMTNFLGVLEEERDSAIFTLFILFQLFNAFNCRELGADSVLSGIGKNKIMVITFTFAFILHIVIVELFYNVFNVFPMCFASWLKIILASFSIIVISEIYKFIYRINKSRLFFNKKCKRINKKYKEA